LNNVFFKAPETFSLTYSRRAKKHGDLLVPVIVYKDKEWLLDEPEQFEIYTEKSGLFNF